jgi:hypothetical protein
VRERYRLFAVCRSTLLLGNGFIVTSLLWGGAFAALFDHRLRRVVRCENRPHFFPASSSVA